MVTARKHEKIVLKKDQFDIFLRQGTDEKPGVLQVVLYQTLPIKVEQYFIIQ